MEITARSAAILLLTCTAGLVQGCASSWHSDAAATPVTYRLPESRIGRGVGNLKRLVVLPVVFDGGIIASFSKQSCAGQQDWLKETFIADTARILSKKKDYRIVRADDPGLAGTNSKSLKLQLGETTQKLHSGSVATVAEVGAAYNADGIVLLRADYGSTIINPLITRLVLEAKVLEVKSGRTAWSGSYWNVADMSCPVHVEALFAEIENAVPDVMIR